MARATIIFSDGSKSMAHNLDDQLLRWRLRRDDIKSNVDKGIIVPEIYVRECSSPSNFKEANLWRSEIKYQKTDAEAWKGLIKLKAKILDQANNPFSKMKDHLGLIIFECNKQLEKLNKWYLANEAVKIDGLWASPLQKIAKHERRGDEAYTIITALLPIIDMSRIDEVLDEYQAEKIRHMIEIKAKRTERDKKNTPDN